MIMRWPNSVPPGAQPYNDDVLAEYEELLRQVVDLADRLDMTGVELLETYRTHAFRDDDNTQWLTWFDDLDEITQPHVTPELDIGDLIFELLQLAGTSDDDLHND